MNHGTPSSISMRAYLLFWIATLGVITIALLSLSEIMLPFVAGMAIAYFLDPVADKFEEWGVNRALATTIIMVFFALLFVGSLVIMVPLLQSEIVRLSAAMPEYVAKIRAGLDNLTDGAFSRWLAGDRQADSLGNEVMRFLSSWASGFVKEVVSQGIAFFSLVSLTFITPIVAFYLLLDWDRMMARIDGWLPRDQRGTIVYLLKEIDQRMAGFVRGTGMVCISLGLFYATALTVLGLQFGFLVGLIAGAVSFVPYLGFAVGLVLAGLLSVLQFWPDYIQIAMIVGVFLVGQMVEGNFLTPRFVGRNVGLHPVWVIFALLAFGVMFGFVGLLIAVPMAAAIGVLMRHGIDVYLESPFYHGSSYAQVMSKKRAELDDG